MNIQLSKYSVQDKGFHDSLSLSNRQVNFTENCSTTHAHDLEWARIAPNKVIAVTPECAWLLENNTKFHFSKYN